MNENRDTIKKMVIFDEEKQKKRLTDIRLHEEEDAVKILSQKYKIPYLDFSTIPIQSDALRLIPEEKARAANMAGYHLTGKRLYVAVTSPHSKETELISRKLEKDGYVIFYSLVSRGGLERAWERYREISLAEKTPAGVIEISEEQIRSYANTLKTLKDVVAVVGETARGKEKFKTSQLLEIFIAGALAVDASDIHIEPEEKNVRLRLRLDGVLSGLASLEHAVYKFVVSRIKLISGLKLNIQNEAQDGRFSIKFGEEEIEVRTSIVPGAYGETIVLRILNPKTIGVSLEELGMEEKLLRALEREIQKPNGMILNTGPTGSGKTTTLYAFLKKIKTPEINILTIEDPIEYHLPGITQTQVNKEKKYTFASGLRAGLRQDPDVIMIGEIRDEETAQTATNAALTGHLVLSTLHTNNASGTIPRLIDLKINPKVIGSALSVSLAQRLVRKLCAKCKIKTKPSSREKKIIDTVLKTINPHTLSENIGGFDKKNLEPLIDHEKKPQRDILVDTTTKRDKKTFNSSFFVWAPGKCERCNNTGYKGRVGVFEAIFVDEAVEKITLQNPSEREIKRAAAGQEILDMKQDGVIKVLQGVTSLSELERVIDLEE